MAAVIGSAPESKKKKPNPGPAERLRLKLERQAAKDAVVAAEAAAQRAALEALPAGTDDDLTAMRYVLNNLTDQTYQHWSFRQWLTDDPGHFREKYASLARADRMKPNSSVAATVVSTLPTAQPGFVLDEGQSRVLELLSSEVGLVEKMFTEENWPRVKTFLESLPETNAVVVN